MRIVSNTLRREMFLCAIPSKGGDYIVLDYSSSERLSFPDEGGLLEIIKKHGRELP